MWCDFIDFELYLTILLQSELQVVPQMSLWKIPILSQIPICQRPNTDRMPGNRCLQH